MTDDKEAVRQFWNDASCGEKLYLQSRGASGYANQAERRYELEPYILEFADFDNAKGKDVLEIGVGLGADHSRFAAAGARLTGVDLTERAIAHTALRLESAGLSSRLLTADAERLPFDNESFDIVYSWGVLHHSPNTPKAMEEVWRVLKPGGSARVMIYHRYSIVGYMLWLRYALLKGRPFTSLDSIYSRYLESPGTKAYSVREGHELFSRFSTCAIETVLTHGDLLESEAGQRHRGALLALARRFWPRGLIRRILPRHGLFMMIRAVK